MPYKNKLKDFYENELYHTYARGVNKMNIFLTEADYKYFLRLLKKYLDPKYEENLAEQGIFIAPVKTSFKEVELIEYCLMPNHFHILIRNIVENGITQFYRKLLSSYSIYFNKKHGREGPLIQGGYRAVHIVQKNKGFKSVGIYI